MSKGIHISEPVSVHVLRSEDTPTEVAQSPEPENQPETAPPESPQPTKVLTPPSSPHSNVLIPPSPPTSKVLTPPPSPSTNPASDHPLDTPILDIQPLQTIFPPHTNTSPSQPPPHQTKSPIANPVTNNSPSSDS
ncbi:pectinesterase inhibitor 10-like [Vicia villosa]|uniref:pectinesterase inhibitor 10-like n=1 Tax=Vicia villosa TaxID=3911 RepID=UPI00273CE8DF|nr:pectinesterase inhibitor 10-like [Vicia villosa]